MPTPQTGKPTSGEPETSSSAPAAVPDAAAPTPTLVPDAPTPAPVKRARITRAMLLDKRPMPTREIYVEGYGEATVRALKEREKTEIDQAAVRREPDGKGGEKVVSEYRGYRARTVAHALVEEDGKTPIFENPMMEFEYLLDLPAAVLDQLYQPVADMNGMSPKAQEALGKDSAPTTGAASSSSSPLKS